MKTRKDWFSGGLKLVVAAAAGMLPVGAHALSLQPRA